MSMDINISALQRPTIRPKAGKAGKAGKPALKIKIGQEGIPTITELLIKNYNRCSTKDVTGFFSVYHYGETSRLIIDIAAFKMLDAIFRTAGRLPEEMAAIAEMQSALVQNIAAIRDKSGLTALLGSFADDETNENETLIKIADTLLSLVTKG